MPAKAKSVAMKLDLSNDEVVARKLFVGQRASESGEPGQLLLETMNSLEGSEFEEAVNVLLDYKRKDLVLQLQDRIQNKVSRDMIQEILASVSE